ncbi:uncharacterized protein LOC109902894 isoform X5 [Oncorhynchus kisutch]|uniref:uncharacterized protein LOC109902894 isoform X5 n=1 Tax=Oncorhynchus kisutch TaxID=8019 RepID=UPI0012DC9920|nr:uncharacterized protein LOC109902894 isoform X5 [Oncorhynchus kisutch]
MEYLQSYHCLLCYLLLALRDPALCAKEITVSPAKPLVKVGDAVTLICETTCSQGKPHWMKLDESDVTQNTTKNRSYLHIAAVHPNHEGKYTCTAEKCREQKKETIQLRVYSFPVPVLSTVPENPVSGQPFKVKCTLTNVYHGDYDTVEMLLLHLERLETEHSKNCNDDRFCDHTWSSKNQMGTSKTDYQCETNLTIGPNSFTEKARLAIHFQGEAGDDYNDTRSTAMSPEQMETQTSEPVSTEGKGQGEAGDDYNDTRSTAMSPEQMETQTSEPVSTEGKGQGEADDDYNDTRSTAMSPEQMETQTSEPVSTEGKGQAEQMETQTSESVSTEGKGQVEASSYTTTTMVALGSIVGFLSILCFLVRLIKRSKRKSPSSGPENHPDGC